MSTDSLAQASISIDAPVEKVWEALVTPEIVKQYMFGTTVVSNWLVGSPIRWEGEWKGKSYEDKGEILQNDPLRLLSYSHYSPMTGAPDVPESYHTVTITLAHQNSGTLLTLIQDNNANEEDRQHSEDNWKGMLVEMKKVVEELHG